MNKKKQKQKNPANPEQKRNNQTHPKPPNLNLKNLENPVNPKTITINRKDQLNEFFDKSKSNF